MHRFLPVIVLILMAPLVAEVLPGSTSLTSSYTPFLLLVGLLTYGLGALFIREVVQRCGRGWASILLLGAAYGLIEEGLALQSLFNPTAMNVSQWGARIFGINWAYGEIVIIIHIIWSVALPILLTELLFPAQRAAPYLRRFGLIITGVGYLLGMALLWLFSQRTPPYQTPPILLGLVVVLVLVLVVVALAVLPRQILQPKRSMNAPHPWVVLLLTGIGAFVGQALNSLLWRIQPAMAQFPLVLVPMIGTLVVAAVMFWLVRHWSQTHGWSDRHLLALASGALIAHNVIGGLIFSKTMAQGITIVILGLVMIVLLALFAIWIRHRVDSLAAGNVKID